MRRAPSRASTSVSSADRTHHDGSLTHKPPHTLRQDISCSSGRARCTHNRLIRCNCSSRGRRRPSPNRSLAPQESRHYRPPPRAPSCTGPDRQTRSTTWCGSTGRGRRWKRSLVPTSALDPVSALSPDGRRLAVSRTTGTSDIWLVDVRRGIPTRFTDDPAFDLGPLWSPDGRQIAFTSNRRGTNQWGLYMKAVDGAEPEEVLVNDGTGSLLTGRQTAGSFCTRLTEDHRTRGATCGHCPWSAREPHFRSWPRDSTKPARSSPRSASGSHISRTPQARPKSTCSRFLSQHAQAKAW